MLKPCMIQVAGVQAVFDRLADGVGDGIDLGEVSAGAIGEVFGNGGCFLLAGLARLLQPYAKCANRSPYVRFEPRNAALTEYPFGGYRLGARRPGCRGTALCAVLSPVLVCPRLEEP